jgi:hypothetical protein
VVRPVGRYTQLRDYDLLITRIKTLHQEGKTVPAIAERLNRGGDGIRPSRFPAAVSYPPRPHPLPAAVPRPPQSPTAQATPTRPRHRRRQSCPRMRDAGGLYS